MLCSEERRNNCITCGYICCRGRFQMLTSHRLSLSFYFVFMIMSWWCFMSLCNELNGFLYHLLLLGSEQVIPMESSMKVKTSSVKWFLSSFTFAPQMKTRSNWSPWQQSKIVSCLLFVDVVIIMLIQITVICASMYRHIHTYSQSPISPPSTLSTANTLGLRDEVYFNSTQANTSSGTRVNCHCWGHQITEKETAVLLSRRSYPLQIALGICLFLSTCSSTYLKMKHWRRVRATVFQATSLLSEAGHLWRNGSSAVVKMIQEMCHGHKKDFWWKSIRKALWPQSLFCFSSVPILFVHMRNKFFYMSVVDLVSPHY